MNPFKKMFASLLAFFSMLLTLILPPPVFPDTVTREKAVFDEGEFTMNSFDIFVSPSGDDRADGGIDTPLRTPCAAKEKARLLKDADCGHVTVWFRAGVYPVTETLAFDESDRFDVTYRSYPGEEVVFSGARELTQWTETTVNGVAAFVTDYTPGDGEDCPNAVYKDDKRLSRPAYPKTEFFAVEKALDEDAFNPGDTYFAIHAAFYADPADLLDFKNPNDVDVRILHYWNDELLPIASLNTATGRVETQKPASMTIGTGDRLRFENVFEALCEPGEWYFDRTDAKLYYIPFEGETTENTVLQVGICEKLITLDGCAHIAFQGIEYSKTAWNIQSGEHFGDYLSGSSNPLLANIRYTPNFPQANYDTPAAVTVRNSESIRFTDCSFRNIGASGLQFDAGSRNCRVEACEWVDIGGNAVYIRGVNRKDDARCTSGITVTDSHITRYGRVFFNAIGVLLIHAYDCELSNLEIHDGYYTGISSGWIWGYGENITDNIRITDNLVYNIGQGVLADMGGIYTLGKQPNSVISGNVVHDVGCYSGSSGYGGWGIYLDEGTSEILVENNIAYNCSSHGFHQHYGRDNMVRNNIFAYNGDGQVRVSRKEEHNSIFLHNNILVGEDSPMYTEVDEGKFTDKSNLYWDALRRGAVLSGNSTSVTDRIYKARMQCMGYYNDGVFADPLFRDAKNGDFTLAQDSPAAEIGFETWDYTRAGTRTQF